MSGPLAAAMTEANAEIGQVREWLLRPTADTISACVPALERAVACMEEIASRKPGANPLPSLRAAAARLQHEIQVTQILLATAGELYLKSITNRVSVRQAENGAEPAGPLLVIG